jgi:hypothetical protein
MLNIKSLFLSDPINLQPIHLTAISPPITKNPPIVHQSHRNAYPRPSTPHAARPPLLNQIPAHNLFSIHSSSDDVLVEGQGDAFVGAEPGDLLDCADLEGGEGDLGEDGVN